MAHNRRLLTHSGDTFSFNYTYCSPEDGFPEQEADEIIEGVNATAHFYDDLQEVVYIEFLGGEIVKYIGVQNFEKM